jgi:hypothetical protein
MQVKIKKQTWSTIRKTCPPKNAHKKCQWMGTVQRSAAYSVPPELASNLSHTHRAQQSSQSTQFERAVWFEAQQKMCRSITRPSLVLQVVEKPTLAGF